MKGAIYMFCAWCVGTTPEVSNNGLSITGGISMLCARCVGNMLGVCDKVWAMTSGFSLLCTRCAGTRPGVSDKGWAMVGGFSMLCTQCVGTTPGWCGVLTHDNSGKYRKQESITGGAEVYGGARISRWAILAVVGSRGLTVGVPKQDISVFAFAPTVGYGKLYNPR